MSDWYVLQTKPRKEDYVVGQLAKQDAEVYFPRVVESVRIAGSRQARVTPMFPSYLFVRINVEQRGRRLRYTPGVRDFLRCDGSPEPVSSDIIFTLRTRTGPGGVYNPPRQRPRPGSRLRIDEGPLRGMDVIFERELSGEQRVAVLLAEVSLQARVILAEKSLARA